METLLIPKPGNAITFLGASPETPEYVVKYFPNPLIPQQRWRRSNTLAGLVPDVVMAIENLLIYRWVPGKLAAHAMQPHDLPAFLDFCQRELWLHFPTGVDPSYFVTTARHFYEEKTYQRLTTTTATFCDPSRNWWINGRHIPCVKDMLEYVDWDELARGIPTSRFHGDLHFANILVAPKEAPVPYVLLDWREEFGGSESVGDVYYDLAKLNHGFLVDYDILAKIHYHVHISGDQLNYELFQKHRLMQCQEVLKWWCSDHGYDWERVQLLTALIFLNIAPLHLSGTRELYLALGIDLLAKRLENAVCGDSDTTLYL